MSIDYLLHESSAGYAIFAVAIQADTIGSRLKEVRDKAQKLDTFGKMVSIVTFAPFQGASQALQNINDVSEGIASNYLKTVIETSLPKSSKKSVVLAVADKNLASNIKEFFPYIDCETPETSEVAGDLLRGVRQHSEKLLKQLQEGDVSRAQLGLGHAYSRAKVKFSVQKNDNHVIQAIATLDHLDKAVNTFAMRVREWYSWHFPELIKLVSDNITYARLVMFIGDKKSLNDSKLHDLAALVNDDESIATAIIEASKVSMGRDISESDMEHVASFAQRTVKLAECRSLISNYLSRKMGVVAPNLATLIGDSVAARLISKAGSLQNLCKFPASTVQILGAEKALFRALKTKGKTPKYGLIYNSSFISKAGARNKGRISRFLANKCSIASRIDNFSTAPSTKFGEALRSQVEERIQFYAEGATPTKNEVAMKDAMDKVLAETAMDVDPTAGAASDEEMDDQVADGVTSQATEQKMRKEKSKKEKKKDKSGDAMDVDMAVRKKEKKEKKRKTEDGEDAGEKKKKKKSKA
ncbi:Nop domain-containing protein [Microthyrium microscopicum]|uniref:Nucleolar protein 56 n=1 Tax=Microthyrium microscopicum TaxID=703497 RepID=A0A6A6U2J3_9PEZI|nr:Nop domain-containing protein [Microthyrium microscopicum]